MFPKPVACIPVLPEEVIIEFWTRFTFRDNCLDLHYEFCLCFWVCIVISIVSPSVILFLSERSDFDHYISVLGGNLWWLQFVTSVFLAGCPKWLIQVLLHIWHKLNFLLAWIHFICFSLLARGFSLTVDF